MEYFKKAKDRFWRGVGMENSETHPHAPGSPPSNITDKTEVQASTLASTDTVPELQASALAPIATVPDTQTPTLTPTAPDTQTPTLTPTVPDTQTPTLTPTVPDTQTPTLAPTVSDTQTPTLTPTIPDTQTPTLTPTIPDTQTPTLAPTDPATQTPTLTPRVPGPSASITSQNATASKPLPEGVYLDKACQLYRLEVGVKEDGSPKVHTVLRLPSDISEADLAATPAPVKEVPNSSTRLESTYNIVMLDTSGSMKHSLCYLVDAFNFKIGQNLDGETDVYVFSDVVKFIRSEAKLEYRDSINKGTNLSAAIRHVGYLVGACPHKHVRVFFITDGQHNERGVEPNVAIERMGYPSHKRVEVYLLGIQRDFPVKYSVQIRSKLHTGAANVSTLFWAETDQHIYEQIEKIQAEMKNAVRLKISVPFQTMPLVNNHRKNGYPGEFLYFDMDPEELRSKLVITVEREPKINVDREWRRRLREPDQSDEYDRYDRFDRREEMMMRMMMSRRRRRGDYDDMDDFDDMDDDEFDYRDRERMDEYFGRPGRSKRKTPASKVPVPRLRIDEDVPYIKCSVLLDNLFKQWCAVLTQMHNNKQRVPMEVFDLMEKSFRTHISREAATITEGKLSQRMNRKSVRTLETEFGALMSTSRNIISVESKYANEIELAEAILKTTVQSKHDLKLLKLKGHGDPDWKKDADEFRRILAQLYQRIKRLPMPTPEECCRILMTSFVGDLQDPHVFELLENRGKLEFLQEITFSGIPVFTPVKDFSQINPWTQHIKNICVSPFEILSQRAMESSMALQGTDHVSPNKEIQLKTDDPTTVFNAIVPIIPREHIYLLRPLLRTNAFSVGCTFCILKNANIVDHNCHIAALAAVWMKTVLDFPRETRPDYIKNRIANVEATARIYLDRPGIKAYIECLLKKPEQALCTESPDKYNDTTIKCESLIKPAFFLHLSRHNYNLLEECQAKIPIVIQRVVMEFLGRCLSSQNSNTPYVDLFLPSITGEARDNWISGKAEEAFEKLNLYGPELLKQHSDLKAVRKFVIHEMRSSFQALKDKDFGWRALMKHERERELRETARRRDSSDSSDMETNEDDETPMDQPEPDDDGSRIPHFVVPVPNMDKITRFRKSGSVGQVSFKGLQAWANEMLYDLGFPDEDDMEVPGAPGGGGLGGAQGGDWGQGAVGGASEPGQTQLGEAEAPPQARQTSAYLIQQDIDFAFGNDMLMVYLVHALTFRESRFRAQVEPPSVAEAVETIEKKLDSEWNRLLDSLLMSKLEERVKAEWMKAYKEAHSKLARPLTRQQIIEQAQARGIDVTKDTFNKVYRYRAESGLCRNCCQVEACPQYLVPNRRFNIHLEVERQQPDYPHTLHLSVARLRPNSVAAVEQVTSSVATGTNEREKKDPHHSSDREQIEAYVEELQRKYQDFQ